MTDSKPASEHSEQQDEKWYERTRYQIRLFGRGVALFGLVLGLVLDSYINPQPSMQKKVIDAGKVAGAFVQIRKVILIAPGVSNS